MSDSSIYTAFRCPNDLLEKAKAKAESQRRSFSPPTYHRWKQVFGGAKEETIKRLKELEKGNARLKRLVADLSLDKAILKEIADGKW